MKEYRIVITSKENGKRWFARGKDREVLSFNSCVFAYAVLRRCKAKLNADKYEYTVVRVK